MNQLFFEILRISIGTQVSLSRNLSSIEWDKVFEIAHRQSLLGICFAGIQKIHGEQQPYETLQLKWMGIAAKIQQRNGIMNKHCRDLQQLLLHDGFRSYILKGQAISLYYSENLRFLRQSGDIDLWVENGHCLKDSRAAIIAYARQHSACNKAFYHHIDAHFYGDSDVELHFTPSWMHNPYKNAVLQRWFEEQRLNSSSILSVNGLIFPSVGFNAVYILIHIYRHLFKEGIGLRQLLDYYFVLKTLSVEDHSGIIRKDILLILDQLGMMSFTRGIMWVMMTVLRLPSNEMICEPDARHGSFILNEAMLAGNFGKYDARYHRDNNANVFAIGLGSMKRMLKFAAYYPSEVFWAPYWKVYHYVLMKRIN